MLWSLRRTWICIHTQKTTMSIQWKWQVSGVVFIIPRHTHSIRVSLLSFSSVARKKWIIFIFICKRCAFFQPTTTKNTRTKHIKSVFLVHQGSSSLAQTIFTSCILYTIQYSVYIVENFSFVVFFCVLTTTAALYGYETVTDFCSSHSNWNRHFSCF